jgi:DNA-binding NarL/FixJ family response regulator
MRGSTATETVSFADRAAARVRVLAASELELLREPRAWRAVVVVPDTATGRRALDLGADGVVLDWDTPSMLDATVRAVACGQIVIPRELHGRMERPALSARERQVLSMIVLGCSNREIARRLHVAETTVKTHVKSSFRKLGVRTRAEACSRILDPASGLGLGILGLTPAGDAP